jgi:hypothetical protein
MRGHLQAAERLWRAFLALRSRPLPDLKVVNNELLASHSGNGARVGTDALFGCFRTNGTCDERCRRGSSLYLTPGEIGPDAHSDRPLKSIAAL